MKQMHDGQIGGHFGVERTVARLQTRYFWYRMREDLVYPKTKVKVVHHDQLKPYRCRDPMDNTWVVEHARRWTPTEVSPPTLDIHPADPILGLSQLFTVSDSAAEAPH
ncbi:hypothetical protein NHX12_001982 [Muraenolepis orangiensis]|uniref:Integrase zinc-binding domain-containing protein n=1 Tax=Muraenolepis orangiensis TaxID=630683 RepID=A0A9Q0E5M4_9TELE|nr:hypothetical protein NHX12_001982 [Muraenolepis orangiensis]